MNILLSTDNNYVMPTGVLMTSIGYNNGSDINYYILVNEEFSDESRMALTRVANQFDNNIFFFTITPEMTKDFPFGRPDQPVHVSIATYYRLFITEILPPDVSRILYLDGDMICRKNLSELWKTNLDGYAVGVVHDCDEVTQTKDKRLPYPVDMGYFNAGMLLINLDYWRENKCYAQFIECIEKYRDKIIFHDQDVLNICFCDKKKWLPLSYNFQSSFIHLQEYRTDYSTIEVEIETTKFDPAIIHYVSSSKPWNVNCFFGYRGAWRYYWRRSPWKSQRLMNDNPHGLKECLRNFLLRHDLWFPKSKFQNIILRK